GSHRAGNTVEHQINNTESHKGFDLSSAERTRRQKTNTNLKQEEREIAEVRDLQRWHGIM
ncbi:MAG TPA: hypothetical protein VF020_18055, partial [Chthoniobacterales bacterium]